MLSSWTLAVGQKDKVRFLELVVKKSGPLLFRCCMRVLGMSERFFMFHNVVLESGGALRRLNPISATGSEAETKSGTLVRALYEGAGNY